MLPPNYGFGKYTWEMLQCEHIRACSLQATHRKISPSGGTCSAPVRPTDIQRTLNNEIEKMYQYIK